MSKEKGWNVRKNQLRVGRRYLWLVPKVPQSESLGLAISQSEYKWSEIKSILLRNGLKIVTLEGEEI